MTIDLWMLLAVALLTLALLLPGFIARMRTPGGREFMFGNRDKPLEGVPEWGQRALRAHANAVENLVPFTAVVLVAYVSGKSNYTTAVASTVFFCARLAHAVSYIAGVKYIRSVVWTVGIAALVVISWQAIQA